MVESDNSEPRLAHTLTVPGDGSVVVALDGELDIATADQLNVAVEGALASVSTCLVVDAEHLAFADTSAIALWVKWSRQVPRLEIHHPRPMVRRVIETMGLRDVLNPS
jgi:anti-sigma B factor antagonist